MGWEEAENGWTKVFEQGFDDLLLVGLFSSGREDPIDGSNKFVEFFRQGIGGNHRLVRFVGGGLIGVDHLFHAVV